MASSLRYSLLLSSLLLFFFPLSTVQTSFRPKALVLRVTKDASTRQYLTTIAQGTPLFPAKLTLDLGGEFLWFDCQAGFNSSSRRLVPCRSAQCNLSGTPFCTSNPNPADDVCQESPTNTVVTFITSGNVSQDTISVHSTDGSNPGRSVSAEKTLFTCTPAFLLEGLASRVIGMAGLGRTRVSLPEQLSAAFSFPRKFAVCLSSSTSSDGFVIFGDGPYVVSPKFVVSKTLTYTPLLRNPVNPGFFYKPSAEYFVGVKSIKVNGKPVPINATLLSLDSEGRGGAKISTVHPYSLLETSIYNTIVAAFTAAINATRVAPVTPFGACFTSESVGVTRAGPAVPPIDLVFQNEKVVWRIQGSNSMVRVSDEVLCLGFVNGGSLEFRDWGVTVTRTAIVIGGHQIEDNLLQFDLASSRLGFSSSLLTRETSCSKFNFTSIA